MRRKTQKEQDADKEKSQETLKISFDTVNEVVLIAAVIADKTARKKYTEIPADYFRGAGHAVMWAGLQELFRRGLEYSPATLREIVGDELDIKALEEIVQNHPQTPPNLAMHVDRLRWHKARYDAVTGPVAQFLESLRDTTTDSELVKSLARKVAQAFNGHGDLRYLRDPQALIREKSRELDERMAGRAIWSCGLPDFDVFEPGRARLIPGLKPGDFSVFAGRSGNGKTTVLARMILGMVQQEKPRRVLWGSWEQGDADSLELLALMSLGMSLTDIRQGRISHQDKQDILDEMDRLSTYVRMFDLPFGAYRSDEKKYNDKNLNTLHQYVAESGCDVAVFDLFHMAMEDTRPDVLNKALTAVRYIAKDTKSHPILVHQIRKDMETQGDPRPTRESISGGSGWVDAPDNVFAVFRPGLYSGDDDSLDLGVIKQREGVWPAWTRFRWEGEYGLIEDGRTLNLPKSHERSDIDEFMESEVRQQKGRKRR